MIYRGVNYIIGTGMIHPKIQGNKNLNPQNNIGNTENYLF